MSGRHTEKRAFEGRRERRQNKGKGGMIKLRYARREIADVEIPVHPDLVRATIQVPKGEDNGETEND